MRWLGLCGALAALFLPSLAVAATPSDCDGIEAAVRASQIESGRTPAEADAYAHQAAAECWEEVKAQEAAEAAQEAEIKQAQDREAEEAAQRSQKEHGVREHSPGLKRVPTVRKRLAEALVRQSLSHRFRGWRRRDYGYADCNHGRVNRTRWSCLIGWGSDMGSQKCGRALAEGEEFDEAGRPFFKVSWQISPDWCWAAD